jgi:hypothetical protein
MKYEMWEVGNISYLILPISYLKVRISAPNK